MDRRISYTAGRIFQPISPTHWLDLWLEYHKLVWCISWLLPFYCDIKLRASLQACRPSTSAVNAIHDAILFIEYTNRTPNSLQRYSNAFTQMKEKRHLNTWFEQTIEANGCGRFTRNILHSQILASFWRQQYRLSIVVWLRENSTIIMCIVQ